MALVAVRTVVDVSVHALVSLVDLVLVGVFMATEARENQIIGRIRVAGIASTGATVRLREICVIEDGSQPVRGAVAGLAGGRETRRGVVRIGGVVVVGLVATDACRVGDAVVAVDVALRAGHGRGMEAR